MMASQTQQNMHAEGVLALMLQYHNATADMASLVLSKPQASHTQGAYGRCVSCHECTKPEDQASSFNMLVNWSNITGAYQSCGH